MTACCREALNYGSATQGVSDTSKLTLKFFRDLKLLVWFGWSIFDLICYGSWLIFGLFVGWTASRLGVGWLPGRFVDVFDWLFFWIGLVVS